MYTFARTVFYRLCAVAMIVKSGVSPQTGK